MKKTEVLKKAKDIIEKEKKEHKHKHIDICLEAGICPNCGAALGSMRIVHFWNDDEELTRCSVNPDHYEELKRIITY